MNYYPTPFADAVNAAFIPPAVYSDDQGAYVVDCKAKAPSHAIKINGTTFMINPLDMILLAGTDENGNDVCISGIDDGGDDLAEDVFILGDTFQVSAQHSSTRVRRGMPILRFFAEKRRDGV